MSEAKSVIVEGCAIPPTFIINLDAPPSERWAHVLTSPAPDSNGRTFAELFKDVLTYMDLVAVQEFGGPILVLRSLRLLQFDSAVVLFVSPWIDIWLWPVLCVYEGWTDCMDVSQNCCRPLKTNVRKNQNERSPATAVAFDAEFAVVKGIPAYFVEEMTGMANYTERTFGFGFDKLLLLNIGLLTGLRCFVFDAAWCAALSRL